MTTITEKNDATTTSSNSTGVEREGEEIMNPTQKRLFELKLKMIAGRQANKRVSDCLFHSLYLSIYLLLYFVY